VTFDRLTAVDAWLSKCGHKHPQRDEVMRLKARCLADYDRAKLARARSRKAMFDLASQANNAADDAESDTLAQNEKGKLLIAQCVRWLLREVKALRERVAQLEGGK
jgi:hypothetical protein